MKALDTNVLVRFLVQDDREQARVAQQALQAAEDCRGELLVPVVVTLELLWVLESAYGIPRARVVQAVLELLNMPVLRFEHADALRSALAATSAGSADLADLVIGHCARSLGCVAVLSFDRKAARTGLFELLGKSSA